MANDSIRGRQVVLRLTNKSGGGLVEGDVVIIDSTTAASVTTTTTAGLATDVVGVALETIAGDAIGRIAISGYVPKINLSGAASLGDTFATHSVAKQAAPAAARAAGHFGEVLGTGTTPAALLWGLPDSSTAGGAVATDTIWDAAGDLVQGTGSNTGARLAIGTANQLLRVNSGATAVEWAGVGRVLISEQTPTGTGTLSWASIPATYKSLEIEYVARGTNGTNNVEMSLIFNNDTTATNYRRVQHLAYGANTNSVVGQDNSQLMPISGASAPAGSCGQGWIKIINYAGTTFNKQATAISSHRYDASSTHEATVRSAVEWESALAINRVDLTLAAGNYDTGSTFRLYGVY